MFQDRPTLHIINDQETKTTEEETFPFGDVIRLIN